MTDYVSKNDLTDVKEHLSGKIDQAVDDLTQIIGNFAHQVDTRFNEVESRLDKLEQSIDRLTNTIDGFVKRLDDIETDNTARDAQLARLDRWIHKIADKTGIKLEA